MEGGERQMSFGLLELLVFVVVVLLIVILIRRV